MDEVPNPSPDTPNNPPTDSPSSPLTDSPSSSLYASSCSPFTDDPGSPLTDALRSQSTDAPESPPTDAPRIPPTDAPRSPSTDALRIPPTNASRVPPSDASSSPLTDSPSSSLYASSSPFTDDPGSPQTDAPSSPLTDALRSPSTDAPESPPTDAPRIPPTDAPSTPQEFFENSYDNIKSRKRKSATAFQLQSTIEAHKNARKPQPTRKQRAQAEARKTKLPKKAAASTNPDPQVSGPSPSDGPAPKKPRARKPRSVPTSDAPVNPDTQLSQTSSSVTPISEPSDVQGPAPKKPRARKPRPVPTSDAPANPDPQLPQTSSLATPIPGPSDVQGPAPKKPRARKPKPASDAPSNADTQLPGSSSLDGPAPKKPRARKQKPASDAPSNADTQPPGPSSLNGPAPKKPRRAYSRTGAVSNVDGIPQKRAVKSSLPLGDYTDRKFYFARLIKKRNLYLRRRGTPEFMKDFLEGEQLHFTNGKTIVISHSDGKDWEKKIGAFDLAHLFETKEGLGIQVPEDLNFETILNHIDPELEVNIGYSDKKATITMPMRDLVEKFKVDVAERPDILNMISLEFHRWTQKLDTVFKVPAFVQKKSMVQLVEDALNKQLEELDVRLDAEVTEEKKEEIEQKKKEIKRDIEKLPRYQNFLLVSMEGAFTDVHIDFSSTCVFYHVKKGRKIFYVAKLTPETWKIYKEFEKDKNKGKFEWIGEKLSSEWERVEIREGQTAMIPSGYIHFVYTPEDSIVIGGNFLMEQSLQNQFDLTELEEYCVTRTKHIGKEHTYMGFRWFMWLYVKTLLIPKLAASPHSEFLNEAAHICLEKMKPNKPVAGFRKQEMEDIARQLRELVTLPRPRPHGPTVDPI